MAKQTLTPSLTRWLTILILGLITALGMTTITTMSLDTNVAWATNTEDNDNDNDNDDDDDDDEEEEEEGEEKEVEPETTNEVENKDDYSMAGFVSALASLFTESQTPAALAEGGEGLPSIWRPVIGKTSTAGAFLAYPDERYSSNVGWLYTGQSQNSARVSYDSLDTSANGKYRGNDVVSNVAMQHYTQFGASLKDLGLDRTSTYVNTSPGGGLVVGASLLSAVYLLSASVDTIMRTAVELLQITNPFRLLQVGVKKAGNAIGGMGRTSGSDAASAFDSIKPPEALQGAANFVAEMYTSLRGMGIFVILPLMIGVALVSLAMMSNRRKQSGARSKIAKDWIVRLTYLAAGVPLMGVAYTATLDIVADSLSADRGASDIVTSTFIDYEAWAMNDRYAIPKKGTIEWDTKAEKATDESHVNIRDTAAEINLQAAELGTGATKLSNIFEAPSLDSDTINLDTKTVFATNGLIMRFINAETVVGEDFATAIQADANKYASINKDNAQKVDDWYKMPLEYFDTESIDGYDAEDGEDTPADAIKNNPLIANGEGGLTVATSGNDIKFRTNTIDSNCIGPSYANPTNSNGQTLTPLRTCNMSPAATYAFLQTDFGGSSASVFSGVKTPTSNSILVHYSSNLVGSGAVSYLYLINAIFSVGTIVVIGLLFAGGLIVGSFKRYIPLIMSAVGSQLGILSMAGRFLGYGFALISELLVTVIVYTLTQHIAVALPTIVESPIRALAASDTTINTGNMTIDNLNGAVAALSSGMHLLTLGLIAVVYLIFLVTAVKSRGRVVNGINAAVDSLISRLTSSQVQTGGGAGLLGSAAGGAGLMMAAGAMGGTGADEATGAAVLGPAAEAAADQASNPTGTEDITDSGSGLSEDIPMEPSSTDMHGTDKFDPNNPATADSLTPDGADPALNTDETLTGDTGTEGGVTTAGIQENMAEGVNADPNSPEGQAIRDAQTQGDAGTNGGHTEGHINEDASISEGLGDTQNTIPANLDPEVSSNADTNAAQRAEETTAQLASATTDPTSDISDTAGAGAGTGSAVHQAAAKHFGEQAGHLADLAQTQASQQPASMGLGDSMAEDPTTTGGITPALASGSGLSAASEKMQNSFPQNQGNGDLTANTTNTLPVSNAQAPTDLQPPTGNWADAKGGWAYNYTGNTPLTGAQRADIAAGRVSNITPNMISQLTGGDLSNQAIQKLVNSKQLPSDFTIPEGSTLKADPGVQRLADDVGGLANKLENQNKNIGAGELGETLGILKEAGSQLIKGDK